VGGAPAVPAILAADLQVLAAALDLEVGRPERHELAQADAGVGQRADDDLVALGLGGVLHGLDLLTGEHVHELLGEARELRRSPSRPRGRPSPGGRLIARM